MATSAILVHFDVHGQVAPHVLRHAQALAEATDRLTIVSSAGLTAAAWRALEEFGTVVERENSGYDFMSWKVGLIHNESGQAGSWRDCDLLILANDSVVGPLLPVEQIVSPVTSDAVDASGANLSLQYAPHMQSFFLAFGPAALQSAEFAAFWAAVSPLPTRRDVIWQYELGLSRLLSARGLRIGGFFEPAANDVIGAELRKLTAMARGVGGSPPTRDEVLRRAREGGLTYCSPAMWLWDRALTDPPTMPYIKLRTLRHDPARAVTPDALTVCEQRYPVEFAGVRDYLERTQRLHEFYSSGVR